MSQVICPQDGTVLGEVDDDSKIADFLAHATCSQCGWTGLPQLTLLQQLEAKAPEYIRFGTDLWRQIRYKIWAQNVMAKAGGQSQSTQYYVSLVQNGLVIKELLESGSLDVVQGVIQQMIVGYPEYSDIATWAIAELKGYLGE